MYLIIELTDIDICSLNDLGQANKSLVVDDGQGHS